MYIFVEIAPPTLIQHQYLVALITHVTAMSTVIWNPLLFYWMSRQRQSTATTAAQMQNLNNNNNNILPPNVPIRKATSTEQHMLAKYKVRLSIDNIRHTRRDNVRKVAMRKLSEWQSKSSLDVMHVVNNNGNVNVNHQNILMELE